MTRAIATKKEDERQALAWIRGAKFLLRHGYRPCLRQAIWLLTRPIAFFSTCLAIFMTQALIGSSDEIMECQDLCVLAISAGSVAFVFAVFIGPALFLLMPKRMPYPSRIYLIAVLTISSGILLVSAINSGGAYLTPIVFFHLTAVGSTVYIGGLYIFISINRAEFDRRFLLVLESCRDVECTSSEPLQGYLPQSLRGEIRELVIEDKYLRVFTDKGEHLVRISLGEAIAKIRAEDGLKIHRSRWVRTDQLVDLKFENGNPRVLLRSGKWVSASRGAVEDIGAALKGRGNEPG